jgi:tRNA pseudouridine38-40 synthase
VPRYKLTIAYDGTRFAGWQRQEPFAPEGQASAPGVGEPNPDKDAWVQGVVHREGEARPRLQLRTVQHMVERAVREIVREPVGVEGASRTDAGVHARGQVAAFTCSGDEGPPAPVPKPIPTLRADPLAATPGVDPPPKPRSGWPVSRGVDRLRRAINGNLPEDVQVLDVTPVAFSFDPISQCVEKCYSYSLHVSPQPPLGDGPAPLWDRWFVQQIWGELSVGAMRAAAERLVGEHDFAAFAAAGHGRSSTVRTVTGLRVIEVEAQPVGSAWTGPPARRLRLEISGNGFLYNMVRIIAGTLVDVGRGKLSPDDVSRILAGKDRTHAGPTLPGRGLCLEWIRYPVREP